MTQCSSQRRSACLTAMSTAFPRPNHETKRCIVSEASVSPAAAHLGKNSDLVEQVKRDFLHASVSEKLKALLMIAGQVQQSGKTVSSETVEKARLQGVTDLEIHDTVLIAAAFCMYNRYVDGL